MAYLEIPQADLDVVYICSEHSRYSWLHLTIDSQ
jgi:hypothetical protein